MCSLHGNHPFCWLNISSSPLLGTSRVVPMSLFCRQNHVTNSGQWGGSRSDKCHFQAEVFKCQLQNLKNAFSLLRCCVHLRGLIYQPLSLCDYNEPSIIAYLQWIWSVSKKYTSFVSSPQNFSIVTSAWPNLFWLPHLNIILREEDEEENWYFPSTRSLPLHPFDGVFPSIFIEFPLSF